MIAPLVNITFVEVSDSPNSYGLMRYMGSTSPEYAYAYSPYAGDTNTGTPADCAGDVVLNVSWDAAGPHSRNFRLGPGSYGFESSRVRPGRTATWRASTASFGTSS